MELKSREIRFNDRNAPRLGKREFSTSITDVNAYEKWKKLNPEYDGLSYKEFLSIWEKIAMELRTEVCTNALGVYFPFYTGELKVQYLPLKVKTLNFPSSIEYGEKINLPNIVSKGKIAKITWQRRRAGQFNRMVHLFGFEQYRGFGQQVYKTLLEHPELYRTINVAKYTK